MMPEGEPVKQFKKEKKRVLMICLEAVFKNHVKKLELTDHWEVDSAALELYHIGESPNERAIDILAKNGIKDYDHVARCIQNKDFEDFDWILGMDDYNIGRLNELKPKNSLARVELLGKYHPSGEIIIEDPYFSEDKYSFQKVYEQCALSIKSFLNEANE
ncbi:low molecular weight phosphotyrosine protein phosphatase-like isoform X2 [Belonocnema kinseyi]|uniref:low molecular weight phosphotyrosine protein phosphatase-like isoform X2 n=1 Tax=Belonocnema kinseyi TaxID=2817044 RepID=UPI00143D4A9C|nr:low molecular weight phosphotyrosine protein phosphatase-like isoform X2 [Belonocnema kinseyi]